MDHFFIAVMRENNEGNPPEKTLTVPAWMQYVLYVQ